MLMKSMDFRLILELAGGDGDKKEGGNEEEDPEVNPRVFLVLRLTKVPFENERRWGTGMKRIGERSSLK